MEVTTKMTHKHNSQKITALVLVVAITLSVVSMAIVASAAVTTYTTEAGNASDSQISVSVADASAADGDPSTHEIKYRISEDSGTYDATIDKVEFQDSNGNVVSSIQPGTTISAGTETEFTNGPHPGDSMTSGTMVVYYTHNGTSYSLAVPVDIDSDDDGYLDSADKYPSIAAFTTTHDAVYDSDGDGTADQSPDNLTATFDSSTGNATVSMSADTDGDGTYETQLLSKDIDTATTTTVSTDVSDVNASSFQIETHGPATVSGRGIEYMADADGDGIADSNDAYPNTAKQTWTLNRTDGESVYSAFVEAHNSSNGGTVELSVHGINQTDGNTTKLTTKTVTVGSDTTLVEADVGDGNRTFDVYKVEFHGNATQVNHGLIYEANSGGGGSTDGGTSLSQEQLLGVAVAIIGAGALLVFARD